MAIFDLLGKKFFQAIERDLEEGGRLGLKKLGKHSSGGTGDSLEAKTVIKGESSITSLKGAGGLPWLLIDKPAGTRFPVDFKGTINGRKIFKLKPELAAWKRKEGFRGSDFVLARSIAEKPRKRIPLEKEIKKYLENTSYPRIRRELGSLITKEIIKPFQ